MDPIELVRTSFKRSEDYMSEEFERLKRLYQLYRAVPDTSQYAIATRSQYVVPLIYKTVETVLPRIISVLFSASPPIQSRWRVQNSDPQAYVHLRALDELFEYSFDHKQLYWVIQAWIKESLIFGQSYVKVGWKKKTRRSVTKEYGPNEEGMIEEKVIPQIETVEDSVDLQNVDIFDLFFSPEAHFPFPFQTSKYVIHRTRKRKSSILEMRDAGMYFPFEDDELHGSTKQEDNREAEINRQSDEVRDSEDPMITVYEYWEDERVITEAEHRVLLRDEANPYGLPGRAKKKPFVACCDNLVYGLLWQIGEAEPLEHTQIEMSTLRRQRTDNNSLIINKMWLYHKDADVDIESLGLSRPGGGVGARPPDNNLKNAVVALEQQDINGASFADFQDLDKDGQEISGLLDYAVGSSPERRETATTVQLLQTAANTRFDIKIRNYSQSFQELGYMMFERWKQLLSTPVPLRIPLQTGIGYQYMDVTRDVLPEYDNVDLIVAGSPGLLMKDARQQKLLQYYESMRQNPMIPPLASSLMLSIALREAEIDGIDPILQLLEQTNMAMGAIQGTPNGMGTPPSNGGISPSLPQEPVQPQGVSGTPQMNEFPLVHPSPRGNR